MRASDEANGEAPEQMCDRLLVIKLVTRHAPRGARVGRGFWAQVKRTSGEANLVFTHSRQPHEGSSA